MARTWDLWIKHRQRPLSGLLIIVSNLLDGPESRYHRRLSFVAGWWFGYSLPVRERHAIGNAARKNELGEP